MTMTIIMMKMTIHLRHSSSSAVSTGAESSLSIPTKVGPIWSLPRWWWWSLWCWWWGTLQYGINSCFCEVIWLLTGWQGLIQGDAFYIVFEIALWGWTNEWMNIETKLQCQCYFATFALGVHLVFTLVHTGGGGGQKCHHCLLFTLHLHLSLLLARKVFTE